MTEQQQAMTQPELEEKGYVFIANMELGGWIKWEVSYKLGGYEWVHKTPDIPGSFLPHKDVLQAATSHYRQQQELARLREAIRAIANALCSCGGDVITDTLPDMFMTDVWSCGSAPVCMEVAEIVVSVWPTVSESERAE